MAEWLRRLTRNQMGSSRVGSNPTRSDDILFFFHLIRLQYKTKADHDGDRTTIFRFELGRLIHWATRPYVENKFEVQKMLPL